MINGGSVDITKKVIRADHCIEYCIDVINKIEDETLSNHMAMALSKCIEVDSGLKELYMKNHLKEILEKNDYVDKSSDAYKNLISKL